MRVVLATANRKKLVEVQRILDGLDVELVPMSDLGLDSPAEDGETFEANALIKARAAAAASGLAALADDSGLEVDALDGEPGVYSARWAGVDGEREVVDAANNAKLVHLLAAVPEAERTGRFVCAAALVLPDGREWVLRGTMEGRIIDDPRGEHGFGYDPHFVGVGEARTNAELTAAQKDARSHRGAAFRAIRHHVETALGSVR